MLLKTVYSVCAVPWLMLHDNSTFCLCYINYDEYQQHAADNKYMKQLHMTYLITVLLCLQVLSCTAVPNTIPVVSPISHSVSTTGKRKQPDSDLSEARSFKVDISSSADGMLSKTEPEQASQPQSAHAEHDQHQQLPQQLPKQEPQLGSLHQQQLSYSPGSDELKLDETVLSQEPASVWGAELDRVVAWCFSQVVEKHLLAELQVET